MNSSVIHALNVMSLKKVSELIPNLRTYSIGREFNELFNEGVEFYQCDFIDATGFEEGSNDTEMDVLVSTEDIEKFKSDVARYNEALKQAQEEISSTSVSEYAISNYLYFSRVGTDIGICHLSTFNRNKSREDGEAEEKRDEHERLMSEDPSYRKEQEWFDEQDRPYGGAFESWGDFYRHVGITED